MKPGVLITGKIPREWLSELETMAKVDIWNNTDHYLMPRQELLKVIGDYEAIVNFTDVKTDDELLSKAKKLTIIANCSIGFDNLDIPLLTSYGIWASNSPGYFSYPVSEYAFASIITISRRLLEADEFVRQGNWTRFEPGRWDGSSVRDLVVGIVGLGETGKGLRTMLLAMGSKVIYYSPSPGKEEGSVSFEELLHTSDIVSIHVPLKPQTHTLFNEQVIEKMRPGAILVNTSRGAVVDQRALIAALQSGKLRGAVLDVFQDEPAVPAALREMKNVLLTPHIAGGTKMSRELSMKTALKNVVAVLQGKRPANALNDIEAALKNQ